MTHDQQCDDLERIRVEFSDGQVIDVVTDRLEKAVNDIVTPLRKMNGVADDDRLARIEEKLDLAIADLAALKEQLIPGPAVNLGLAASPVQEQP